MRNLADLELECTENAIAMPSKYGKRELMDLLAEHYYTKNQTSEKYPRLHQVPVMLSRKLDDLTDSEQQALKGRRGLVVEPKYDGCSALIHIGFTDGKGGFINRVTTRRRSDETYRFTERTDNFPWLRDFQFDQSLRGTVVHAEFVAPAGTDTGDTVTETERNASSAVMNCGAEKSASIQTRFGHGQFHVFDILFFKGLDLRRCTLDIRRKSLSQLFDLSMTRDLHLVKPMTEGTIEERFALALKIGYEGVMLKDPDAFYAEDEGSRPRAWYKMKKRDSFDGWIDGFIPGEAGWTGLVGGLKVWAYLPNGTPHWFAAVSNIPLVDRKLMSAPDGSLKPEYYHKVVEVSGQGFSARSKRLNHATLDRWRDDKPKDQCLVDPDGVGDA